MLTVHEIRELIPPRQPTLTEKQLLDFLLSKSFPGRDELREQVKAARVSADCNACPTIELVVDRTASPHAPVKTRIPIEAEGLDVDGMKMHFLLHVVDDFLSELEVFREDGESILKVPNIRSLELVFYGFGEK